MEYFADVDALARTGTLLRDFEGQAAPLEASLAAVEREAPAALARAGAGVRGALAPLLSALLGGPRGEALCSAGAELGSEVLGGPCVKPQCWLKLK